MTPSRTRVRWSFTAALGAHVLLLALLFAAAALPRGDAGAGGDGVGLESVEGNADVEAPAVQPAEAAPPQNQIVADDDAATLAAPQGASAVSAVPALAQHMALHPGGTRGGDPFLARVRAHLVRYRRELPPAIRGVQGVVQLRFSLLPSGAVTQVSIAKSSGNDALDQEALQLLMRAQPLPARDAPVELTVPIEFEKTATN